MRILCSPLFYLDWLFLDATHPKKASNTTILPLLPPSPPTVVMMSSQGVEYTFVGMVSDANHNTSELNVVWSTDVRELCPATQPDVGDHLLPRNP